MITAIDALVAPLAIILAVVLPRDSPNALFTPSFTAGATFPAT